MARVGIQSIADVAIVGHGSTGKTSLVDLLLHKVGQTKRLGKVDDGTSLSDYDEEEKAHKFSIDSTLFHFSSKGREIKG